MVSVFFTFFIDIFAITVNIATVSNLFADIAGQDSNFSLYFFIDRVTCLLALHYIMRLYITMNIAYSVKFV